MAGEVKLVRFSEGVSTTSPTPSTTQIANLVTYSSSTSFLAAKGSAVARGDIFFNSAETSIYFYEYNKWRNIFLEKEPLRISSFYTSAIDDSVIYGNAEAGEFTVMLLDPASYPTKKIFTHNVGSKRSIEFKASNSKQFFWDRGAVSSIYLSGNQHAELVSDGTYWVVKYYNPLIGYAQDRKALSTDGGTSISGNPQTRVLNSISGDATNFLSLPGSNRMLIERGRVDYEASAPAFVSGRHQLIWVNASDSSIQNAGMSANNDTGNAVQTIASIQGTIDASNSKLYELWHFTAVGRATDGLGLDLGSVAGNPATFVTYAEIKLTKRL